MIGFPQEMAPSEEVDCNLSCQNHISKAQKIYSGWIRGNGCWKSRAQGQKSIGRMQLMYANTWRVTDFLFPSPLPHSYDLVFSSVSLLSKFTNVVNITTLQLTSKWSWVFFNFFGLPSNSQISQTSMTPRNFEAPRNHPRFPCLWTVPPHLRLHRAFRKSC